MLDLANLLSGEGEPLRNLLVGVFPSSPDGEPQANLAIFFWPVLWGEEPITHLTLGISDENGEISAARLLPPGQYELFTTPVRGYTKFGPGAGGPPGFDYRSLGRISWPQDGKPSTINVRVRADDAARR